MDQELFQVINEARKGKQLAFENLISKYKGAVYRQAYAMLGDHMEAEDVTQEVFIKVYYSFDSLDSPYAFSAWVTKITFNLCYDQLEKRKKKSFIVGDDLDQFARENSQLSINGMVKEEIYLSIQEAMQKLPVEQREIIILRDIQGYSYDEMASLLEIPSGTIKSRIYYARLALKNELKK